MNAELRMLLVLGVSTPMSSPMASGTPMPEPTPEESAQHARDTRADADWLLLPFQSVGGLAGLCWCLIGLAVFLSPLLFLVWVLW